ncbi:MAG: hypothetical protein QF878_00525, partial [SAR202 cluster bacterium]|nr:hypothetical protein [SAR202 cluster bacterium]
MRKTKLTTTRFFILFSLVAIMSPAAVAVAQASTPKPSSGEWFFTGITSFTPDKFAGGNMFYTLVGTIAFTGTLEGTGVTVETGIEHGGGEGPLVASAVIHFTGTIDGSAPGSIDIKYNRLKHGGFADASIGSEGNRVFVSNTGTGGLANLHGTAHFDG